MLAPTRPLAGVETRLAVVLGTAVALDGAGAGPVVREVLRQMAARLGDEGAEVPHPVLADQIAGVVGVDRITGQVTPGPLEQRGIEVLPAGLQPGEPGEVVDPRALPDEVAVAHAGPLGEQPARPLHRM